MHGPANTTQHNTSHLTSPLPFPAPLLLATNRAVEASGQRAHSAPPLKQLRNLCHRGQFVTDHPWLLEVPSAVRDDALRDFDKAVHAERAKARKAKKSKKQHRPAKFRFRSRKDSQCIEIQHRDWGRKRGMFAALFAPGAMRSSEPLPDKVQCAVRVTLDRLGRLHVCYPVRVRGDNQAPGGDRARQKLTTDEDGRHVIHVPQPKRGARNHSVIALDPGVRTFMTCYDADGAVVEWGRGDMRRICALCWFADKLQGRIETLKGPRHKARRRRMRRLAPDSGDGAKPRQRGPPQVCQVAVHQLPRRAAPKV